VEREPGREPVSQVISPQDGMYVPGRDDHYFSVGENALRLVLEAMWLTGERDVKSILDLPCGHGRVLRHLRAMFPHAAITACDLDRDGVDFCVQTFGAIGVYSEPDLRMLNLAPKHDVIFCGSLLTHLDASEWQAVLRCLNAALSENGFLIFTTHGRRAYKMLAEGVLRYGLSDDAIPEMLALYRGRGFAYAPYSTATDYGVSFSAPSWVLRQLEQHGDLRLVHAAEMAWDNHHDVFVCARATVALPARAESRGGESA
jgi:SAM-dependent methyltransferase